MRGINRRVRRHDDGGEGHNAAPAELPAADGRVLHAAIVAPFAGIVHVGLALLEQPAVATEGVEAFRAEHVRGRVVVGAFVRIDPRDLQAFSREKTFRIGDLLRQPLERGRVLDDQRFHAQAPRLEQ